MHTVYKQKVNHQAMGKEGNHLITETEIEILKHLVFHGVLILDAQYNSQRFEVGDAMFIILDSNPFGEDIIKLNEERAYFDELLSKAEKANKELEERGIFLQMIVSKIAEYRDLYYTHH